MARFTSDAAAAKVGGRFNLVLVASHRARQIKRGSPVRTNNPGVTSNVTALREIEEGKYTYKEFLESLDKKVKQ
jgi:DNA-directed RNA polymerase subunit omega